MLLIPDMLKRLHRMTKSLFLIPGNRAWQAGASASSHGDDITELQEEFARRLGAADRSIALLKVRNYFLIRATMAQPRNKISEVT